MKLMYSSMMNELFEILSAQVQDSHEETQLTFMSPTKKMNNFFYNKNNNNLTLFWKTLCYFLAAFDLLTTDSSITGLTSPALDTWACLELWMLADTDVRRSAWSAPLQKPKWTRGRCPFSPPGLSISPVRQN